MPFYHRLGSIPAEATFRLSRSRTASLYARRTDR